MTNKKSRDGNFMPVQDIQLMKLIATYLEEAPAGTTIYRTIEGFPNKKIAIKLEIEVEEQDEC